VHEVTEVGKFLHLWSEIGVPPQVKAKRFLNQSFAQIWQVVCYSEIFEYFILGGTTSVLTSGKLFCELTGSSQGSQYLICSHGLNMALRIRGLCHWGTILLYRECGHIQSAQKGPQLNSHLHSTPLRSLWLIQMLHWQYLAYVP